MKKCICFFCDIAGTIQGRIPNEKETYQRFNDLLSLLQQGYHVDYILFSLISSESKDMVMEIKQILSGYFSSFIIFGRQFFDQGYFENGAVILEPGYGKAYQMTCYLKQLEQSQKVEKIYYADDCVMFQEFFFFFAEDNHWNEKLLSLIPNCNTGLVELNQLLDDELVKLNFDERKRIRNM